MNREILVVPALLVAGCQSDPDVGGKRASQWRQELTAPQTEVRRTAVAELARMGPTAKVLLPEITASLRDGDAGVRGQAVFALEHGPVGHGERSQFSCRDDR